MEVFLFKDELEGLYLIEKKSTWEIARLKGCSQMTVRRYLKSFQIPARSYKENKLPTPKGGSLSESHKTAISNALKGKPSKTSHLICATTGRHINFKAKEVSCSQCGWKFEIPPSRQSFKRNFCSHKCHGLWKAANLIGKAHPRYSKQHVKCAQCSYLVLRSPNQVKRFSRFFCSVTCVGLWKAINLVGPNCPNYRGGHNDYRGPSWYSARRAARKRDNDKCQNCFRHKSILGKELDVHHIIPFKFFGVKRHHEANQLANLISYCNKCHKTLEEKFNKYGVIFDDYHI